MFKREPLSNSIYSHYHSTFFSIRCSIITSSNWGTCLKKEHEKRQNKRCPIDLQQTIHKCGSENSNSKTIISLLTSGSSNGQAAIFNSGYLTLLRNLNMRGKNNNEKKKVNCDQKRFAEEMKTKVHITVRRTLVLPSYLRSIILTLFQAKRG